ncbi:MAG: HAD family hydrolase [Actinomycetota bacterium]
MFAHADIVSVNLPFDAGLATPYLSHRLRWDVSGVLPDELAAQFGIEEDQMREEFFMRGWNDVIRGRRSIETVLREALQRMGATADVESVLACWFEADYSPVVETFDLARRAAQAGCRVVLATNQEHRRAEYLRRRIAAVLPLDRVFYSAELGVVKHDRRFFELASLRLDLADAQRASVVFVDDVAENVEVARAVGWRAVHASVDESWRHEVEDNLGLLHI